MKTWNRSEEANIPRNKKSFSPRSESRQASFNAALLHMPELETLIIILSIEVLKFGNEITVIPMVI